MARGRSTVNRFSKTVYIPQSPQQAFDVVNDIEAYPEFVPWCSSAKIVSRDSGVVVASLSFRVGLKTLQFTTRNISTPYSAVDMSLVDGPFRCLEGRWRFDPSGPGTNIACEVDYEFASTRANALFNLFFPRLMGFLVSSFVNRARR